MLAVISDIHSNIEALQAVMDDIESRGITTIICLGDAIGYGPDPGKCLDLLSERATVTLMGNHDFAVLYEPTKFNVGAESACYWTRQFIEDHSNSAERKKYWDFLGAMPIKHVASGESVGVNVDELMFVHGSPRKPVNEYLFPDDVFNAPSKMQGAFDRISNLCFVGHTHVPGVFVEAPDFYPPDEIDSQYEIKPKVKALINVGSVGQPRDRDKRASYVVVEADMVRFVRVEYDIESVINKVRALPQLDDYLGVRLRDGR